MGIVRYTVANGQLPAASRDGVAKRYVGDPLGSTAALVDPTGTVTDTFTYWPYGEERTRTGTTPTPFRYVGTLGYYRDDAGRTYVRARTLASTSGRWITPDPIALRRLEAVLRSPKEATGGDHEITTGASAYQYGAASPASWHDWSGRAPNKGGGNSGKGGKPGGGSNRGGPAKGLRACRLDCDKKLQAARHKAKNDKQACLERKDEHTCEWLFCDDLKAASDAHSACLVGCLLKFLPPKAAPPPAGPPPRPRGKIA